MKSIMKDGQKIVVAESADEAMRMFKRQLKARRNAIVNDDPERYNGWDDEEKGYNSFLNHKDYYDYGI